jgi:hypothetical protein
MHITDSKQVWGFHIDSFQEGATTNYLLASGNWLGRLSKQANQQIQQTNQNDTWGLTTIAETSKLPQRRSSDMVTCSSSMDWFKGNKNMVYCRIL